MSLPHLPSPVSNSVNPGCSSPADQCFPPAPLGMGDASEQTRGTASQSSGECQFPSALGGGVTVTAGSAPLVQLSGEGGSRTDVRPADVAQVTGRGLAVDVMADSQCAVRASRPAVAECTPRAVDVAAGTGRPGGLPANVVIR